MSCKCFVGTHWLTFFFFILLCLFKTFSLFMHSYFSLLILCYICLLSLFGLHDQCCQVNLFILSAFFLKPHLINCIYFSSYILSFSLLPVLIFLSVAAYPSSVFFSGLSLMHFINFYFNMSFLLLTYLITPFGKSLFSSCCCVSIQCVCLFLSP